eukprot:CAMPEP_0170065248 /NCGR_PEP_ID=MMETSP0019_2-20121128/5401_1 /TAXON_ID=98059 /ORGANISM="Dinobryon sp., Strain UTEXLB2267" /LENGTH=32 /DNA_ID= /DNA_START= /DNA_END= /DNA_ORIENTATION=
MTCYALFAYGTVLTVKRIKVRWTTTSWDPTSI